MYPSIILSKLPVPFISELYSTNSLIYSIISTGLRGNIDEENLIDTESTDDDEITLNTKLERLKLNDKKTQGEEKIRIPLEYQDILKDN